MRMGKSEGGLWGRWEGEGACWGVASPGCLRGVSLIGGAPGTVEYLEYLEANFPTSGRVSVHYIAMHMLAVRCCFRMFVLMQRLCCSFWTA